MSKIKKTLPTTIFLIGYMGAGKSTVGLELSKLLSRDFYDLDKLIETREKKSIAEIFSTEGEEYFREIEHATLLTTLKIKNAVIAAGGGTPAFHENMKWMNEHGTTIYLRLHPGTLFHRLAPIKYQRPLISNLPDVDLMEFILDNIKKRLPFYVMANHTVSAEESPVSVARSIQLLLNSMC